MKVENAVYPKREQLEALVAHAGDGPIVMLNLLKFRDKAVYKDGRETDLSGRDAYMQYGAQMAPFVIARGGKMHFSAAIGTLVIGEVGDLWDAAALMEYPSAKAFVEIATSPEVAGFGVHREAGLEGQLLIQCRQGA